MRRRWLRSLLAATCVMVGDRCGLWAVGDGQGPQALIVGTGGRGVACRSAPQWLSLKQATPMHARMLPRG